MPADCGLEFQRLVTSWNKFGMTDASAGKLLSRRSSVWLACVVVLATSIVPRSFAVSVLNSRPPIYVIVADKSAPDQDASAAGVTVGRQAVAGAVRAGNFLGVTFGFPSDTLAGTSYKNGDSTIYDHPMYVPDGNEAHFWDSYVEQLQTAASTSSPRLFAGSTPTLVAQRQQFGYVANSTW
jgi:Domain of unknown function (DUF5010)